MSSVPKHILLYQYFGWELPVYAHLPLLLNPDKSKLSKRQGDVAVEEYRAKGYLKEAIVNFIAFLGWNPGDEREIFSLEDLVREFSLERVGKSGAVFNVEKLNWLNQQHLRRKSDKELAAQIKPVLQSKGVPIPDDGYLQRVVGLLKERLTFIRDSLDFSDYFFEDPKTFDEGGVRKNWEAETSHRLGQLADRLERLQDFTSKAIEECVRRYSEELGIKPGKLIHPTRMALSGKQIGPGLFEMIEVLGRETVVRRLRYASEHLRAS